jgi:hypothetical protein
MFIPQLLAGERFDPNECRGSGSSTSTVSFGLTYQTNESKFAFSGPYLF